MTIDDPTLAERTFTETHDRILHALVEQVHEMNVRMAALEAAAIRPADDTSSRLAPPAVPGRVPATSRSSTTSADTTVRPIDQSATKTRSTRPTRAAGWQPARR